MFENFISLGNACPVAASMEKWGIRSWSGPFDWLITYSLKEVLYCLETNFTEFLVKDNLMVMDNGQSGFMDRKNGFRYLHDGELGGYDKIFEKYQKRIERFNYEIKKPCCFLRGVNNNEEICYISQHMDYIHNVISKGNEKSNIIFLMTEGLNTSVLSGDCQYFVMRNNLNP